MVYLRTASGVTYFGPEYNTVAVLASYLATRIPKNAASVFKMYGCLNTKKVVESFTNIFRQKGWHV